MTTNLFVGKKIERALHLHQATLQDSCQMSINFPLESSIPNLFETLPVSLYHQGYICFEIYRGDGLVGKIGGNEDFLQRAMTPGRFISLF